MCLKWNIRSNLFCYRMEMGKAFSVSLALVRGCFGKRPSRQHEVIQVLGQRQVELIHVTSDNKFRK